MLHPLPLSFPVFSEWLSIDFEFGILGGGWTCIFLVADEFFLFLSTIYPFPRFHDKIRFHFSFDRQHKHPTPVPQRSTTLLVSWCSILLLAPSPRASLYYFFTKILHFDLWVFLVCSLIDLHSCSHAPASVPRRVPPFPTLPFSIDNIFLLFPGPFYLDDCWCQVPSSLSYPWELTPCPMWNLSTLVRAPLRSFFHDCRALSFKSFVWL